MKEHNQHMRATGMSMFPAVWPGSHLALSPARSIDVGDIVVYLDSKARLTAHRVVATCGTRITTRGDAQARCEVITREAVLHRVTAVQWPCDLAYRTDSGPGRLVALAAVRRSPVYLLVTVTLRAVGRPK